MLELGYGDKSKSTEEDAESLVWNNRIAPVLQQLENVAAGSVSNAISKKTMKN